MATGRPSKTVKWGEHGLLSIPIYPHHAIFTCEIDRLKRPSTISEATEGQKCIVILIEDVIDWKQIIEQLKEELSKANEWIEELENDDGKLEGE